MDSLLPQLLAFPPHPAPAIPLAPADYHKQIISIVQLLGTTPASKLTSSFPGGGDLLSILDPSINTIPYLYALLAHISGSGGKQKLGNVSDSFRPGSALWQKMSDFMDRFDPVQIRYAGNELRRLIDLIANRARHLSQTQAALVTIRTAILRLDPAGSTFTSLHLTFARICLETRLYALALPVLDKDIYYFPQKLSNADKEMYPFPCSDHETSSTYITRESGLSAKLVYRDHLKYFLFGAMLYMGLKEWKRALLYLEIVILTPVASNASKIQVEAYKKWVLVSLLQKGRRSPMPKTISTNTAKQYQALSRAYDVLAEIFEKCLKGEETNQKLVDEANAGVSWWNADSNFGLVYQVIDAYRQFSVLQLEKTFAALTIADITRKTSPNPNDYAETAQCLVQLIAAGKLNATISKPSEDPASWVVRFSDPTSGPLARSEEQQYEALAKQTQKVNVLTNHMREMDRKLSLNKDYIGDARRKKKQAASDATEENRWAATENAWDHDEDMMGDL